MNKFLRKALLVVGGVILSSTAWAQTNTTVVGNEDKTTGWWSAFSDYYTIEPNQTLKLKFKNHSDKTNAWHNFITVLSTNADRGAEGYSEYLVYRADSYAWQGGLNTNNDQTWFLSKSDNYNSGTLTQDLDGAEVNLTVKRVGTRVTVRADFKSALDGTTDYYEQLALDCGDGTQDIRMFLTVEKGYLEIDNDSKELVASDPKVVIGATDNTTPFWGAHSEMYKIEPNKTLTLEFENYSSKANAYNNWVAVVSTDALRNGGDSYKEYLVLRADNYGWNATTNKNDNQDWFRSWTSNCDWVNNLDNLKNAFDGSTVKLTFARGGDRLNVHADITGSNGESYYIDVVLLNIDADKTIRAFLTVDNCHLILDDNKTTKVDTEVTGTVSASGYNTFSSIFPLDLSTINGAKAYAATSINANNAVELEEATGKVPAEYGLMVQGVANAEFTVKPTSDATAEIENNMLVGMPFGGQVTKATEGFNYVFGYTDPAQPGFYQVDGVLPTLQAGRAYLYTTQDLLATSTGGAPALTISLGDDEATGLRSIDNEKLTIDNVYYDLSGRRVAQPTKGVYVVNGKKVVIK